MYRPPSSVARQLAQISDSIFSRLAIAFGSPGTTKSTARIPILPPVCLPLCSPFIRRYFSVMLMSLCPPVHNYFVGTDLLLFSARLFFAFPHPTYMRWEIGRTQTRKIWQKKNRGSGRIGSKKAIEPAVALKSD